MTPDLGLCGEGRAERAEARIMSCFAAFRNASREDQKLHIWRFYVI